MLKGKKAVILIAEKFHEEETTSPRDYLVDLGIDVDLVGSDLSRVNGKNDQFSLVPDKAIKDVKPGHYDLLIIPGGGAPERLRLDPAILGFVRDFWNSGRPVAAICHGPQVLISAKVLEGVTLTANQGIKDDLVNAGATWADKNVNIDGQLITARGPKDLPALNQALERALKSGFVDEREAELDVLSALTLAISREKGAREFYQGVAKIVKAEKLRNKFNYLATVELEHFENLSELFKSLSGGQEPDLQKAQSEIGKQTVKADISAEEAIALAIQAEQKAYDFYRNAALKSKSAKIGEMFEYLASEELEHKRLLLLDKAIAEGGGGHFQWATHFDIPPGMEDLW